MKRLGFYFDENDSTKDTVARITTDHQKKKERKKERIKERIKE